MVNHIKRFKGELVGMNFYDLDKQDRIKIANKLVSYLSLFFIKDYYFVERELQEDLKEFLNNPESQKIIANFTEHLEIDITPLLNPKKWGLCSVCHRPFISVNRARKSNTCYWEPYISYTSTGKPAKSSGVYSRCWMVSKLEQSKRWYLKNKQGPTDYKG